MSEMKQNSRDLKSDSKQQHSNVSNQQHKDSLHKNSTTEKHKK